jgi:branched-subunit amino acid ABC-type transport system permease component
VGGVGSIRGALFVAFVFGVVESFVGSLVDPDAAFVVGLLAMLVLLSFKPEGMFGFVTKYG